MTVTTAVATVPTRIVFVIGTIILHFGLSVVSEEKAFYRVISCFYIKSCNENT